MLATHGNHLVMKFPGMGLFCAPGHSEICRNEIANELRKEGSIHQLVGPLPALGILRQNTMKKSSVGLLTSI